ncbi:IS110 family transposase [Dokdonella sp. MW10]|uniref:IS110 family transposase n=1 Tax=Dokdonella sp. MW10 TaxID=2992926 RepID=UPI003F7EE62C
MTQVIGVDVAKASFDVAAPLGNGKFRTRGKIANTAAGWNELLAWRQQHAPEAAVCMEATGTYHEALARALHEAGVTVFAINPARIKAFGISELSRTKTDRTDAKLIARFFLAQQATQAPLQRYIPPTPSEARLRALVRRLEDLKDMRQMEANRRDVADASVTDGIDEVITLLDTQIRHTEKAIRDHIDDDPDLRGRNDLLTSIPGIGKATSAVLMTTLGDLSTYTDVRQIVAYAGLNPAQRQSGRYAGKVCISRIGNADLRAKLFFPAISAMKHNPAVAALAQRLKERGKTGKRAVCAAMRKLLHIVWGVLRSGKPFDPQRALAGT